MAYSTRLRLRVLDVAARQLSESLFHIVSSLVVAVEKVYAGISAGTDNGVALHCHTCLVQRLHARKNKATIEGDAARSLQSSSCGGDSSTDSLDFDILQN